ncbi:MAG: P-type conjugative transfer protein TrbL [Parvularculaceae bacterium]
MNNLNVIDQFTATFVAYIDSGFGLLQGDVGFLTAILIGIDIVLAGLFWSMNGVDNVLGAFIKKVLYVGAFAFIINNFRLLADIIFASFAGLGLVATGSPITAAQLMQPGFVADTGYQAAYPLLGEANALLGFPSFFSNFVTIAIIMLAWLIVLFAFFILAIQLFVTIIEFKLTTLAGFVLVPFALWNKTSFLAERVLGNVMASGIKLMVLAIIVGIGSTIFGSVTAKLHAGRDHARRRGGDHITSLALLALGIFGPGIATGLVSGAPQLGAGAAVATSRRWRGRAYAGALATGGEERRIRRAIGGGGPADGAAPTPHGRLARPPPVSPACAARRRALPASRPLALLPSCRASRIGGRAPSATRATPSHRRARGVHRDRRQARRFIDSKRRQRANECFQIGRRGFAANRACAMRVSPQRM